MQGLLIEGVGLDADVAGARGGACSHRPDAGPARRGAWSRRLPALAALALLVAVGMLAHATLTAPVTARPMPASGGSVLSASR
ncbi:MAG: hypothetical protein ACOZD0_07095 [Pseudomonadota bacterium]